MSRLIALTHPFLLATLLAGCSLATMVAGCSVISATPQIRGNKVDPDVLKELVPGTSTRADVTSLIGSPTAKASFDDNTWLYITETTQPRIGRVAGVNDQGVVVLSFDGGGTLRGVRKLDQSAGEPVDVVARTTPSPGSEATFLQQLLGNVGKFNATPNPGGGANTNNAGASGAQFGAPGR